VTAKVAKTRALSGFPASSFKYTPLQHVRVLFVSFVQGLFQEAPPGCYKWSSDIESTEIIITDENPIHVEKLGMRPAITFTRGPVQFYSLGIDDMMNFDFRTEKKTKAVLVPGTMTINCCSRSDLECENIAWIVAEHIWLLRELFMKMGFFDLGRQPQIGSPSPAGSVVSGDQAVEWFVTAVAIPFQFPRLSSFTPLGNKVAENIELTLNQVHSRAEALGATGGFINHELPLGVTRHFPSSFAPDATDTYGRTPDPSGSKSPAPLPIQPHPLNPASSVTVRTLSPFAGGVRPAGMNGAALPIKTPSG